MPKLKYCFSVFLLLFAGFASAQNTTGVLAIDTLKRFDWDIETKNNSLPMILLTSLVFPGGGQFYTGHNVRGGFLLAFEGALIYEAGFNKFRQNREFNKNIRTYKDSVALYQVLIDFFPDHPYALNWQTKRDGHANVLQKEENKKRASRDLWNSEFAWLAGLHIYGMFDAYGIWRNNQGRSHETHFASSALWRAIVVPGWGQIYNDEYGKAGMLYMGLFGSAVSYWSRQEMVDYHLEVRRKARFRGDTEGVATATEDILFFRKKRNQYVWAISLFYIYSMADAAVDAMLHDFDSPAYFVMQPTFSGGFQTEAGFRF